MDLKKILDVIISPWFLFSISAVLLIYTSLQKRDNFFSIRSILHDQFSIFNGAKRPIFVLYGIPVLLALATVRIKEIDDDIINNIVVIQSIFMSMLFAMLSIIGSSSAREKTIRRKLMDQTFNSIMFESIICITLLIISFVYFFTISDNMTSGWCTKILSCIVYYLMYTMILNTFIILKRLKTLFEDGT